MDDNHSPHKVCHARPNRQDPRIWRLLLRIQVHPLHPSFLSCHHLHHSQQRWIPSHWAPNLMMRQGIIARCRRTSTRLSPNCFLVSTTTPGPTNVRSVYFATWSYRISMQYYITSTQIGRCVASQCHLLTKSRTLQSSLPGSPSFSSMLTLATHASSTMYGGKMKLLELPLEGREAISHSFDGVSWHIKR